MNKEISMKKRFAPLIALAVLLPLAPAAVADDESVVQVAANDSKESRKESRRAPNDEEALALAALEGLMNMPADRALPILKRVLAGNQSDLVKKRAFPGRLTAATCCMQRKGTVTGRSCSSSLMERPVHWYQIHLLACCCTVLPPKKPS